MNFFEGLVEARMFSLRQERIADRTKHANRK